MRPRTLLQRSLAAFPCTVELWEKLHPSQERIPGGYRLDRLAQDLPNWIAAAEQANAAAQPIAKRRRVLVIAGLRWWVEYGVALGLYLHGLGHEVDLGYLPYRRWSEPVEPFHLRRQRAYLQRTLSPLQGSMGLYDLSLGESQRVPAALQAVLEQQALTDVQYTQQRESLHLEPGSEDARLLALRRERNACAAAASLDILKKHRYDSVIIPNGSILEFGAVYLAAKNAGVRTLTYEFGEQRQRMWLAQDDEVMRLDTAPLWSARGSIPLQKREIDALQELYQARRGGKIWANFARRWQSSASEGAQSARSQLGLDPDRPLALLCTNVVGDSLALGRQIFTDGMVDWLDKTTTFFAQHPEMQFVVRVHPGELLGAGHPSVEIVRARLPQLPEHVKVIPPESNINTYDLIEIADLGLVYTTTVGMEMAMSGVPVVVSGKTHYRGKGFTHDPDTLEEYYQTLNALLTNTHSSRLSQDEVQLAMRYAYRFFFEYPFAFPWHLVKFWDDIDVRPLKEVLRKEACERYEQTLSALLGEAVDWRNKGLHDEVQS